MLFCSQKTTTYLTVNNFTDIRQLSKAKLVVSQEKFDKTEMFDRSSQQIAYVDNALFSSVLKHYIAPRLVCQLSTAHNISTVVLTLT